MPTTDPQRSALQTGLGMASPLWPAFVFAASLGATYWWMSRLTPWRTGYVNLEAMLETPAPLAPEPVAAEPTVEPVVEAAAELAGTAVDQAETITQKVADAAAESVKEAVEAAPAPPERAPLETVVAEAARTSPAAKVSRKSTAKA